MPNPAAVMPIGPTLAAPRRPLSVDDAVRAALSFRPSEVRSFGNEDDVEGPRSHTLETASAIPAP